MKVLVSLGTQKQQFTRILRLIENSDELKCAEILVQAGHTKYKSDRMNIIEFMNQEGFNIALNDADIVICHGGVGTIFSALKSGKKVLAVPRLAKYDEHVDDHQLEICRELQKDQDLRERCVDYVVKGSNPANAYLADAIYRYIKDGSIS